MTSSQPWVLLDSGIGGLVYAHALRDAYPRQSFVYVADNLNFPYGEKSLLALYTLLENLLAKVEEQFNPAGVVFVCNTATVNCLDLLVPTKSYPLKGVYPFAGYSPSEPPVRNTLCLSTSATLASDFVQAYLKDFPDKVRGVALPALVQLAETGNNKWSHIARGEVESFKSELGDWQIQDVCLGCTHFIALQEWLSPLFPRVHFVDSRYWLVELFKEISVPQETPRADFYLTLSLEEIDYYFEKAKVSGFSYQGVIS